jgi:predicted RNA binding protein YcfA (HicA-like mRNA interferase family)
MPKLHSSRHIIAVLMKKGFVEIDQTGSHKKLRKDDRTVIVPRREKNCRMERLPLYCASPV